MSELLSQIATAAAGGVIAYHLAGWLRRKKSAAPAPAAVCAPQPLSWQLGDLFDPRTSGFTRPELLASGLDAVQQYQHDKQTGIAIIIVEPDGTAHGYMTGGPREYERQAICVLLSALVQRSPHWHRVASACRAALGLEVTKL